MSHSACVLPKGRSTKIKSIDLSSRPTKYSKQSQFFRFNDEFCLLFITIWLQFSTEIVFTTNQPSAKLRKALFKEAKMPIIQAQVSESNHLLPAFLLEQMCKITLTILSKATKSHAKTFKIFIITSSFLYKHGFSELFYHIFDKMNTYWHPKMTILTYNGGKNTQFLALPHPSSMIFEKTVGFLFLPIFFPAPSLIS